MTNKIITEILKYTIDSIVISVSIFLWFKNVTIVLVSYAVVSSYAHVKVSKLHQFWQAILIFYVIFQSRLLIIKYKLS